MATESSFPAPYARKFWNAYIPPTKALRAWKQEPTPVYIGQACRQISQVVEPSATRATPSHPHSQRSPSTLLSPLHTHLNRPLLTISISMDTNTSSTPIDTQDGWQLLNAHPSATTLLTWSVSFVPSSGYMVLLLRSQRMVDHLSHPKLFRTFSTHGVLLGACLPPIMPKAMVALNWQWRLASASCVTTSVLRGTLTMTKWPELYCNTEIRLYLAYSSPQPSSCMAATYATTCPPSPMLSAYALSGWWLLRTVNVPWRSVMSAW